MEKKRSFLKCALLFRPTSSPPLPKVLPLCISYAQKCEREKDSKKAQEWFQMIVDLRGLEALIKLGKDFYFEEKIVEAESCFREGARRGCPDAMQNLGSLFYKKREIVEALKWWQEGAKGKSVLAMEKLGYFYFGDGQIDHAIKYYKQAAELGSFDAMVNLGAAYKKKGDIKNAAIWWQKAANQNDKNDKVNVIKNLTELGIALYFENKKR